MTPDQSVSSDAGVHSLVVVPQDIEFFALLKGFKALNLEPRLTSLGRIKVAAIEGLHLLVAVCGHGKTQAAVQTQYLIDRCTSVRTIICAGAAGSLSSGVILGDVVVGTHTVEHDYKLRFVKQPSPVHPTDSLLLVKLRNALRDRVGPFDVHFAPIASGDEDVVDRLRAEELRADTGAWCVAWEGSGAARAAAFNGLAFVEIRVITDASDDGAKKTFDENLQIAMPNVAVVLQRCRTALTPEGSS